MSFHTAYLVLGTNLGNRYKNLSNARLEINEIPQTRIIKKSKMNILIFFIFFSKKKTYQKKSSPS